MNLHGPRIAAMALPAKSSKLGLCLLPFLAAGCADLPAVKVIRDDVSGVSLKVDSLRLKNDRSSSDVAVRLDTLRTQVRGVSELLGTVRNGQMDQLRADLLAAIQQLSEDNKKLSAQVEALQQRVNDFQDQLQISKAAPKGDSTKSAAVSGTEKLFRTASEDFQKGRYDLAYKGFQDVVNRDSTKVYAPKALYQMAETRYAQRNWEESRTLYKRLTRDFSKDPLVCPAWFKIGLAWQQQGKLVDRDSAWSWLDRRCPGSNESQRARDLRKAGAE